MANRLNLDHIMLVFDQAIYAKAQQIRWADDHLQKRTIVRMGEFHTTMSFMSTVGKRFKNAGMVDILIEAEIIAEGSINGVVSGHHYNRSIRAHKLLYEALQRCRLDAFMDTLPEDKRNTYMSLARRMVGQCFDHYLDLSDEFQSMMTDYQRFVDANVAVNPTFSFWSSYIDMIQILLLFIRATRESDWHMHLAATRLMLPWLFAYDRTNYARYLPAYWLEMTNLEETHPESYRDITARGQWTVQRTDGNSFSSIACDQAIEQTCNRDSKTKGGITGFTLNRGAVQRWILAQPERSAITRQCELMAGIQGDDRIHKSLDESRMLKDERDVSSIISTINGMINPFDCSHDELVSLSSGVVASDKVKADLLEARDKGEKAVSEFMIERLVGSEKDIFSPLKALRLKTFETQAKKKVSKTRTGKEITLKYDRNLFARLLVIGQTRKVNLHEVLKYSLGPVSFPLANTDGSMNKPNKSALLQLLESKSDNCLTETVPPNGALLIDGMALLQALGKIPSTFGEVGNLILSNIVSMARHYKCSRVDFVTDTYPSVSIKNIERSRRASSGSQKIKIHGKEQKTPLQWKKFMSNGDNKQAFVEFLFIYWQQASFENVHVHGNLDIYVVHGSKCHKIHIYNNGRIVTEVQELESDHEEADTRLLLHARHATDELYDTVIIRSPDTDVAVIALSLLSRLDSNVYFLTGIRNRTRVIDLKKLANDLSPSICSALIGLHVFTGCDSITSFYGKGKKKPYSTAVDHEPFLTAFSELGTEFTLKPTLMPLLEGYVCRLYGHGTSDVNHVRYKIFCTSKSEQSMPPTRDALEQHCLRANYQAAIHRRAMVQFINAPSPVGHGWQMENDELSYKWMTQPPAPDILLEVVQCSCKTGCESGKCSCAKSKVNCTDMCKCVNCSNCQTSVEIDEDYSSDSDEDFE